MPELAEVEWFRRQWDAGLRQKVTRIELHDTARIFRGTDVKALRKQLTGAVLRGSEARGKQMIFRFSGNGVLGLHLGMTGGLSAEAPGYEAGKHDHLVLRQQKRALVFRDARKFGRVRFAVAKGDPDWWAGGPPGVLSAGFTTEYVAGFLQRRARLPLKAALLLQSGFPGIGNWMADEILWQARLHPRTLAGRLSRKEVAVVRQKTRAVCQGAMRTVGKNWGDPPEGWLFHERWQRNGVCPRHGVVLESAEIGGRKTRWCARCQPAPRKKD